MKRLQKLCMILIATCCVAACQPDVQKNISSQQSFIDIQEITTPDGISVWLVEDPTLPIIALQFLFLDSGTALDPANKQGLVRMLSNTMDEGAGDLDSTAFQKALADHSINLRFSASRDGFGGNLKTLTRHKDKAFDLLEMALSDPRFDAAPVERMRQANMTRIRSSLSKGDWIAARIQNDRMFEGHAYAMNSGGTLSSLPAITPEDLRNFYERYLTKDRLIIVAAGDISADDVSQAVDRIFTDLPATAPADNVPALDLQNQNTMALYEKDIPQTFLQIALPAFGREDEDYYALQVLNYIFGGGGFGSRLMEEAREKRGLTYGIYSSVSQARKIDLLRIGTSTKNEAALEMLDVIQMQMQALKTGGVSTQELANAKSYLTGSLPLSMTSTDRIASVLMGLRTYNLPADYLNVYADHINAVTTEDIQRVAQRILNPENMTVTLVGQPENADTLETLIKIDDIPNAE